MTGAPATACFTELCNMAGVPENMVSLTHRNFCAELTQLIFKAGGGGLLEAQPCPFLAMMHMAPSETDTNDQAAAKLELAAKVGITTFTKGEID